MARQRFRPCITLTTDFGTADGYVGAMKGTILRVHPRAVIVDITHDIPPQDVRAAAFVLASVYAHFPPGTVHVVVVDPTVGTGRRLVAAALGSWTFVAPDNGVLTVVACRERARRLVHITNRSYAGPTISTTFQGRDILAPAAAHLARGVALHRLGPPLASLHTLAWPAPRPLPGGGRRGAIIYSDRFGNLITNLAMPAPSRVRSWQVRYRHRWIPLKSTYAAVPRNAILAVVGSAGLVELAMREGSARAHWRARIGERVDMLPG